MTVSEPLTPRFYIVGERKCGTSSLYRYIVAHPHVLPGKLKEPNFFGRCDPSEIPERIDEYLALFPSAEGPSETELTWPELDREGTLYEEKLRFARVPGREYITGEASANTFQDVAPEVLRRHLPDARLILLVRDPVERAYSHHRMLARFQEEGRDLGFEVGDFDRDIREELDAVARGEPAPCLEPGLYAPRLRAWLDVWGWGQIRVYRTEDLDDPSACSDVLEDVQRYLSLPAHAYGEIAGQKFNKAPDAPMPEETRARLAEYYRPFNRDLEHLLGRPLGWGGL